MTQSEATIMQFEDVRKAIRDIPDFPKEGIIFKDITPVLKSPELFGKILLIDKVEGGSDYCTNCRTVEGVSEDYFTLGFHGRGTAGNDQY